MAYQDANKPKSDKEYILNLINTEFSEKMYAVVKDIMIRNLKDIMGDLDIDDVPEDSDDVAVSYTHLTLPTILLV